MPEKLSLSELQAVIRDSLYISFPDMLWVVAEISEIKENYAGHRYLELVEKQGDSNNIKARIRAVIWCKKYSLLNSYFRNVTGEALKSGLKILIKARIEYHELYGLSLDICDIDPAYTIGELSVRRQLIIKQLEEEGIFEMNRQLELPLIMQRIAVISSKNAAGYQDFINHLENNSYGYVYYTKLFESPVQGSETETGIIKALDRIVELADKFDAVAIIRGGGSQVDLSWFDNYNIAYHITQFPLPVFTGIGHEKDMSVTDMVAFSALKTPTAVADFIVEHNASAEKYLINLWTGIQDASRTILEQSRRRVDSARIKLLPMTRNLLSEMQNRIAGKVMRLVKNGTYYLNSTSVSLAGYQSGLSSAIRSLITGKKELLNFRKNSLKPATVFFLKSKGTLISSYEKTVEILNPENVLMRGYTITYRDGTIMKSSKTAANGDQLITKFRDGTVSSRVDEIEPEIN
ncbi:MAG TPA: exodeoxyribonuclease VII large subunit [Bacteroidales bacterium]|nr:exodeoxyribonuclease VII large subunit [Bacteroidales bacterium]